MAMKTISSSVSVCLAALYHHIDLNSRPPTTEERRRPIAPFPHLRAVGYDIVPCVALYLSPPNSIAALLKPCSKLLRQWPKLMPKSSLGKLPKWLTGEAGPYGYGCGKFCEVICAYILLSIRYQSDTKLLESSLPRAFELGPMPGHNAVLLVVVLSAGVNMVLSLWSNMTRSKGSHAGVDAMVKNSMGRQISIAEHIQLACLAFGNAICEEAVSRGFFYFEFVESARLSPNVANIGQAIAFGAWHYNGIPSGFTGVGLTFVYGLMMGVLREYGGGLLLPIFAHTIADYFIFSVIVRK